MNATCYREFICHDDEGLERRRAALIERERAAPIGKPRLPIRQRMNMALARLAESWGRTLEMKREQAAVADLYTRRRNRVYSWPCDEEHPGQ